MKLEAWAVGITAGSREVPGRKSLWQGTYISYTTNNNNTIHLLISLYISVPHDSQSQSTLYNQQSTHPPLPLPFLPFSDLLMAALLLYMLSPTVVKSKFSIALSEISYFYYLAKLGKFGVPNWILQGAGTELFKSHKTGTNRISIIAWLVLLGGEKQNSTVSYTVSVARSDRVSSLEINQLECVVNRYCRFQI